MSRTRSCFQNVPSNPEPPCKSVPSPVVNPAAQRRWIRCCSSGYLPPVNTMPKVGQPLDEQPGYPLELVFCPACALAQINFVVRPDILFPPDYPYTTGTTRILRENFSQLSEEATALLGLKTDQLVWTSAQRRHAAFQFCTSAAIPCSAWSRRTSPSSPMLLAFAPGTVFSTANAHRQVVKELGQPALVTAANVFAHIPDPVASWPRLRT